MQLTEEQQLIVTARTFAQAELATRGGLTSTASSRAIKQRAWLARHDVEQWVAVAPIRSRTLWRWKRSWRVRGLDHHVGAQPGADAHRGVGDDAQKIGSWPAGEAWSVCAD